MKKTAVVLLGAVMALAMTIQPASAAMNTTQWTSVKLANVERTAVGRPKAVAQACLQRHAEAHANRMLAKRSMHHQSGAALRSIMRTCKLTSIGENLATGRNMSAPQVVNAWMRSTGHRANLLNPGFNRIAASYRTAPGGQRYWIQLYGRA